MYPPESYQNIQEQVPTEAEIVRLTERAYAQVFRTDFTQPGFTLISFRREVDSISLRRFMAVLKDAIAVMYWQKNRRRLSCLSMMHFDQQTTTKFHIDGAPDESYLMLGYEPSTVQSVLCLADYTRAAYDLNLTPQQFLTDYNPMYTRGEQQLLSYTTRVEGFDTERAYVLLINNSSLPLSLDNSNALGVMHQATILTPDPTKSRVVHSIMLAVSEVEDEGEKTAASVMQQEFLANSAAEG